MFLNKSTPNHHSDDFHVPMLVRRKQKRADPCAFKAFQQFLKCFHQIPKESLAKKMTKANNMTSKVTTKKAIWLLNQWHATMAIFFIFSTLEISVRYILYINMLTFVSLVVFWRYFLSKIVWFIKILFYRFQNLSLAMFLTCFLIFLHFELCVS